MMQILLDCVNHLSIYINHIQLCYLQVHGSCFINYYNLIHKYINIDAALFEINPNFTQTLVNELLAHEVVAAVLGSILSGGSALCRGGNR